MTDYRDPKVTTPTRTSGGMGTWIGIAVAVVVALLLVYWLWPRDELDVETVPVVPEATVSPPATEPAPAEPAADASPQFQEYPLMVCPSGSTVPTLLVAHVRTVQVAVNVALGPVLPAGSVKVTWRVAVPTLPHTSLTDRTMVYVPGAV